MRSISDSSPLPAMFDWPASKKMCIGGKALDPVGPEQPLVQKVARAMSAITRIDRCMSLLVFLFIIHQFEKIGR